MTPASTIHLTSAESGARPQLTCSESGSRPGLTSLIKTGRGLMTVQTEILGEPARLVTIVDFRGRVLKSWQSSFLVDPGDLDAARRWHQTVEKDVRASLGRAAKRAPDRTSSVAACLFSEAMRAYVERDYARASLLLDSCARLVPDDARVAAARERLQDVGSR